MLMNGSQENSLYKNGFEMPVEEKEKIHSALKMLLALVIVLLVFVVWSKGSGSALAPGEVASKIDADRILVEASAGSVITGFPEDFILEDGVEVSKSYSVNAVDGSTSQPVVEYDSALSLAENVANFKNYLEVNNWTVLNEADPASAPITSFYARKENKEVNITLNTDEDGAVSVVILFIEHK